MYKNIQPKVLEKNSNSHINSWFFFLNVEQKINKVQQSKIGRLILMIINQFIMLESPLKLTNFASSTTTSIMFFGPLQLDSRSLS
jgi:hypothetical protein